MEEIRIQGQYIHEQLLKGIRKIYAVQKQVASNKMACGSGSTRSGALMKSLTSPEYSLTVQDGSVHGRLTYPKEIRFQDIKRLGNWRIYNKQVWGILYKETFRDIRFEFSDWLRENFKNQLSEALKPLNKQ